VLRPHAGEAIGHQLDADRLAARAARAARLEQAEEILERGEADFVGAARQSLADPDWFRKVRLGYGHLVRRCEFTNYCEGLDQQHKQVTCKLWDRVDVDAPGVRLARDGKRRLAPPSWTPPKADAP